MKISLVSIYVSDPNQAHEFYTGVLGFVSRLHLPEAQLAIVASAEEPDGTGLLLEPNSNPIARTYQQALYEAGLPVIVFGVDDVAAEFERLGKSGVAFRSEPVRTEQGTAAVFDDGFGNLVQLFQIGAAPGS